MLSSDLNSSVYLILGILKDESRALSLLCDTNMVYLNKQNQVSCASELDKV